MTKDQLTSLDSHQDSSTSVLTAVQHAGSDHRVGRGLVSATEYAVTFRPDSPGGEPIYQRLSNTANNREVAAVLASLFGTEGAFVTCSGMAALHLILTTELRPGDEILCQEDCYGSSRGLIDHVMTQWGLTVRYHPAAQLESQLGPNTRAVLCETIANPFCRPFDIRPLCAAARARGVLTIVDNTFASPFNCRPSECGADYVWESATKYLNGHSDQVAGVIATDRERLRRLEKSAMYVGCFLGPEGCVRLLRGLRTFPLRMERHNANGRGFATAMSRQEGVDEVYYGGSAAQTTALSGVFARGFGGMVCLRFAPQVDVMKLCASLQLAADVPSLGGTETTVCMPLYTTHTWMAPAERERLGVTARILRVSVGLESLEDILRDFAQAIRAGTSPSS